MSLNPVKTSVHLVKTSLNPVKTSLNLVKAALNPVKASLNLIKASVYEVKVCFQLLFCLNLIFCQLFEAGFHIIRQIFNARCCILG